MHKNLQNQTHKDLNNYTIQHQHIQKNNDHTSLIKFRIIFNDKFNSFFTANIMFHSAKKIKYVICRYHLIQLS